MTKTEQLIEYVKGREAEFNKSTGMVLLVLSGDGYCDLSLTDINWLECLGGLAIAQSIAYDNLKKSDKWPEIEPIVKKAIDRERGKGHAV